MLDLSITARRFSTGNQNQATFLNFMANLSSLLFLLWTNKKKLGKEALRRNVLLSILNRFQKEEEKKKFYWDLLESKKTVRTIFSFR